MADGDGRADPEEGSNPTSALSSDGDGRQTTRRSLLAALGIGATGVGLSGTDVAELFSTASAAESDGGGPTSLVPIEEVTHRAVQDGRWNESETWEGGAVPGDDARVLIESDTAVTIDHEDDARLDTVRVDGTLEFDRATNTHLRVDTIVTTGESTFRIGTGSEPVDPGVTAQITFLDGGPIDEGWDPDRLSRGLIVAGDLEIHGAETTSWSTLASHPTAGDGSLALLEAPTNWSAGDRIVVPGLSAGENQDEERTIAGVDGSTIDLDEPLEYDHVPPEPDLDAYALNLSRNVRFVSENDATRRRGHVMVASTATSIRYLECEELGRTDKSRAVTEPLWDRGTVDQNAPRNPRARYAVHFHRTGLDVEPHLVEGCAVRGSPGWGIVNHGSNAEIVENVTYRVLGSGIVAERGNEVGRFVRNFALRSAGSGEPVDARKGWRNNTGTSMTDPPNNVDDFGHAGHGFWLQCPTVEVEGNVAAGHRHHGFVMYNRSLLEEPLEDEVGMNVQALDGKQDTFPDFPAALLREDERDVVRYGDEDAPQTGQNFGRPDLVFSDTIPIRSFTGNEAFACGGGLDLSRHVLRREYDRPDFGVIEEFTAYNIGPMVKADGEPQGTANFESSGNVGIDHRYTQNVLVRNCRLLGDGSGRGIYTNLAYSRRWDVEDSTIAGWDVGIVPSRYRDKRDHRNVVRNCHLDNDVDVHMTPRSRSPLLLESNTYGDGGEAIMTHGEMGPGNLIPHRAVNEHSRIVFEGRTVHHGWSDPEFVVLGEGDDERASKMLNHGNTGRWANLLGVEESGVREALEGATHQELYDQYGITFYGGPAQHEAVDDDRFVGLASHGYGTAPVKLGPATTRMPTDEIWIDAVEMTTGGNAVVVGVEDSDGPQWAFEQSTHGGLLELTAETGRHEEESPVLSAGDGVASFEFEVDRAGTYELYARVQVDAIDVNDRFRAIHARFDGGDWGEMHRNVGGRRSLDWPSLGEADLSAGTHTVSVAPRTPRATVRLDKLLVKRDDVPATPLGRGKPHTTHSRDDGGSGDDGDAGDDDDGGDGDAGDDGDTGDDDSPDDGDGPSDSDPGAGGGYAPPAPNDDGPPSGSGGESPFPGVDVTGDGNPATSTSGSDVLDDVDGDGRFDRGDVEALFEHRNDGSVRRHAEAFDVTGDDDVSVADVQELYERLTDGGG